MDRRCFSMGLLASTISFTSHARPKTPPTIDAVARIKALRIATGPLTSAYQIAPYGRLNWYFTNLGLIAIVQYLNAAELDLYVRRYLDLYIARLETNATIQDVNFNDSTLQTYTLVPSDSDNSYAATFVSLAARYLRASANWAWWEANQATLKTIVQANIIAPMKPNGLCRVFQTPRTSTVSEYGYTMDNCEDYRGLRDLSELLKQRGQTTQASVMLEQAHQLGLAINNLLWDSSSGGYRVSDQDTQADTHNFYPGSCCQVFAQAFGVVETSSHDDAAYRFLNTFSPRWPKEAYDPYPWCILGYVAAKRGDTTRAQTQLATTDTLYQTHPERVTINELGFYQRTRSLLQGRPDI